MCVCVCVCVYVCTVMLRAGKWSSQSHRRFYKPKRSWMDREKEKEKRGMDREEKENERGMDREKEKKKRGMDREKESERETGRLCWQNTRISLNLFEFELDSFIH